MEEVWKGIGLSSLHHHSTATATTATATTHHGFLGLNLQDSLARPSSKDPQTARCGGATTVFGCLPLPPPSPATVLSLSSGSEFHYLESSDQTRSYPQLKTQSNGGSGTPSLVSSTPVIPSFCKKRASENDDNSVDWRHKRMIKNRESAARSRSRKQAYTNGLENEVNRLMEENAKLKRQLQKLCSAAPDQLPNKYTLQRTLTAPF